MRHCRGEGGSSLGFRHGLWVLAHFFAIFTPLAAASIKMVASAALSFSRQDCSGRGRLGTSRVFVLLWFRGCCYVVLLTGPASVGAGA